MACVSENKTLLNDFIEASINTTVANSKQLPRPLMKHASPITGWARFWEPCRFLPERGSVPGKRSRHCAEPGVTRALAVRLLYIIRIIGRREPVRSTRSDYNMYYVNVALDGFQCWQGNRRACGAKRRCEPVWLSWVYHGKISVI